MALYRKKCKYLVTTEVAVEADSLEEAEAKYEDGHIEDEVELSHILHDEDFTWKVDDDE